MLVACNKFTTITALFKKCTLMCSKWCSGGEGVVYFFPTLFLCSFYRSFFKNKIFSVLFFFFNINKHVPFFFHRLSIFIITTNDSITFLHSLFAKREMKVNFCCIDEIASENFHSQPCWSPCSVSMSTRLQNFSETRSVI